MPQPWYRNPKLIHVYATLAIVAGPIVCALVAWLSSEVLQAALRVDLGPPFQLRGNPYRDLWFMLFSYALGIGFFAGPGLVHQWGEYRDVANMLMVLFVGCMAALILAQVYHETLRLDWKPVACSLGVAGCMAASVTLWAIYDMRCSLREKTGRKRPDPNKLLQVGEEYPGPD